MKIIWKLLLGFIIFVVAAYLVNNLLTGGEKQLNVFCINETGSELVKESRNVKAKDNEELVNKTILELKKIPNNKSYRQVIPENVDVERISLDSAQDILEIDFTKYFEDLSNSEKLFLRSGVALTYLEFEFVKGVKFFVDGLEMKDEKGKAIGIITKEDVVVNPAQKVDEKREEEITLYFADEDGTALVTEKRKVEVKAEEKLEEVIIKELIKGPNANSNLISPIPNGTVLKDIEVMDGICYVNFNKEFKTNHIGGSNAEKLTIYSIVNSLTELEKIEKVQFLIDGQKQSIYKGDYEFDKPFERQKSD